MVNISKEALNYFKFKLIHKDKKSKARAGILYTPRGEIKTPVFMPVGTHGAIKAQQPSFLIDMQIPIILSNTYHLNMSPGPSLIEKAGGLHKFINWPKAILTDSGGFQVFSLNRKKITEKGVEFKDQKGKISILSPETSIKIQEQLNSDIMMAFDECIPYPAKKTYVKDSIDRTHRWLERCIKTWTNKKQALFGIIQGSIYPEYRKESAKIVCSYNLPGYAIGGVSVGEGPELMQSSIEMTVDYMPEDRPRYAMGIGTPEDLLMIWKNGIDMSDCIIPTKFARGGTLFTLRGKLE